MAKLDKHNRLIIPKNLRKMSKQDFTSEIALYMRGKELYFDTSSSKNYNKRCFGKVKVESNGRFYLPKLARMILNLYPGDNFVFYLYEDKIFFKKIFFIPENR